jgi:hypothetical protein
MQQSPSEANSRSASQEIPRHLWNPNRNKLFVYGEELLASRLNSTLDGQPLSSVRDCLFKTKAVCKVRGLTYNSESELCGGAVTVSFSKYLTWQAMHFLQRSTHFSKMCCRPLIASKFLVLELPYRGWKSREIARGEIWIEFCVRFGKSGSVEPH